MMKIDKKKLSTAMILLGFALQQGNLLAAENSLSSIKIDSTVILDGIAEPLWDSAQPLQIKVNKQPYQSDNYKGIQATDITIKSLYDNQHVYFLVQYADPTKSIERFPWQKQKNGQWKQLKDKDQVGHSNIYYEDKFAFLWEINAPGFEKKGCDVACHLVNDDGKIADIDQKGITAGRKYTRRAGETIDMWHWKSVRMNPVGVIDDQFIDDVKDPQVNANWGRHGDAKKSGGYVDNINEDKSGPAFMNRSQDGLNDFTITPSQKTVFVDNFKTGDLIPGIVSEAFTGSRGDIWSRGVWNDGVWTIELKRQLITTGELVELQDVQFTDLKKTYHFGVAVFDNSQIDHLYHDGSLSFTFK
ncbi:MAG: hypothetical protein ACJAT7_003805 [Psychromonas sp.]|jgi:hypothetical protein|uniref:ethylbenzene dehydrogenase-related protein n=1 Tax=Psychromonas sp. TaxID=1884585 RepID=UPI0039E4CC84